MLCPLDTPLEVLAVALHVIGSTCGEKQTALHCLTLPVLLQGMNSQPMDRHTLHMVKAPLVES